MSTFVQFSLVAQSCLTLCDPVDCSTPGFPVHHQLPELAQTHVHQVGDVGPFRLSVLYKEIQPVHPEGDQSQVFIGRTYAEAETPIL